MQLYSDEIQDHKDMEASHYWAPGHNWNLQHLDEHLALYINASQKCTS